MLRRAISAALLVVLIASASPGALAEKTFELDFRDTPIPAVLQALARAAGVNLVVEGDISGRATLHLKGLTFDQALALIAAAYRLTYRVVGGVYVVRQLPQGGESVIVPGGLQLALELRAYPLKYASAEELASVLTKALAALTSGASGAPGQPAPVPVQQAAPGGQGQPQAPPSQSAPPSQGGAYSPPSGQGAQSQTGTSPAAPPPQPAPAPQGAPSGPAQGGAGVVVVADPGSNTLLVAAPAAVHFQLQAVLRALDVPQKAAPSVQQAKDRTPPGPVEQAGPSTVSVQVKYADLDALSKLVASEVKDVTINTDQRSRRLLITGPARARERAIDLIGLLDRPVPQVMMSTRVVELNENASRKLGIQWNWSPQVSMTQTESGIQFGSSPPGLLDMVGQITAAVEEGQGRVLANPQVASQDGKKATINVGQTLYIPITTTQAGQTTTTLQTINAGIKLEVTPRIVDPKRMIAELNIEVNSLAGFGPGNMPIINSRAVNTTLEVADGSPIIIGGLISDTTTELLKKIPILGDIPIIGEIFKYRETTRNYSNIVIIIVPRILMPAVQESK
jgi:type II secretory pathway component GspD/PulD (secretin)